MGCCGLTPFEVPRTDRITADPGLVTCAPVRNLNGPKPVYIMKSLPPEQCPACGCELFHPEPVCQDCGATTGDYADMTDTETRLARLNAEVDGFGIITGLKDLIKQMLIKAYESGYDQAAEDYY